MRVPARWLLLAGLLFAPLALGTEQVPDVLLLDGERLPLHTYPLAGWLKAHPGTLPDAAFDPSNNWRGYIATWEIADGRLWLRKVDVSVGQREGEWDGVDETWPYLYENVRDTLFSSKNEVVASWFSGALVLPKGKQIPHPRPDIRYTHERYTLLWICRGEMRQRTDVGPEGFVEFLAELKPVLKPKSARTEADLACKKGN